LNYYRSIPQNVRNGYDLEDMIQEVTLHVVRKTDKYSPAKAKESTWVWAVANRKCLELIANFNAQKYTAGESIELSAEVINRYPTASFERQRSAMDAVERVIEIGSDRLQDFIEGLLSGKFRHLVEIPDGISIELAETARRCAASTDDFLLVLQYASK